MAEEDILAKLLEKLLAADEKDSSENNAQNTDEPQENDAADSFFGGIDLDAVLKLGELFSQMNKPDKNTRLLLALKPHLRPENQQKVDNALRLMKILDLLPLLKEAGLLNGLFGL